MNGCAEGKGGDGLGILSMGRKPVNGGNRPEGTGEGPKGRRPGGKHRSRADIP